MGRSPRSRDLKSCGGNTEWRETDQHDKQRQFGEGHEKETEARRDNRRGATAMRQHHSEPSRDQQSGRGRGNPAEDMLKNRILSVLYTQHADNEADWPRDQKKS